MMHNKRKFVLLSIIVLILSVVVVFILLSMHQPPNTDKQSVEDNTSHIIAQSDKPFYIEIPSTPATGYQWQADFDSKALKLVNVEFKQTQNQGIVGATEIQVFEFQPLAKQDSVVTLQYVRPWEKDVPAADTKIYKIFVK